MSLTTTIETQPTNARGLAIVVTNDYDSSQSPLSPISGTVKDGKNMSQAFQRLGFTVHWEKNIGIERFQKLMCETKEFKDYNKFKKYKCFAFVFSGHGKSGDHIYMQDGKLVCIGEQIIEPLLPKNCNSMGNLPKLFFIDACRGDQLTKGVLVPKGGDGESCGIEKIEMKRVPAGGNFLVAYSTLPDHRAWEHLGEGGAWLRKLAEKIQTSKNSIEDVLTEVNRELVERDGSEPMQQPDRRSTLNEVLFLYPSEDKAGQLLLNSCVHYC